MRLYFRCRRCCGVWCTDAKVGDGSIKRRWAQIGSLQAGECPQCGQKCNQYMGPVEPSGMAHEGETGHCNGRCHNAPGPHCDCECHGKHHGEDRLYRKAPSGKWTAKTKQRREVKEW